MRLAVRALRALLLEVDHTVGRLNPPLAATPSLRLRRHHRSPDMADLSSIQHLTSIQFLTSEDVNLSADFLREGDVE